MLHQVNKGITSTVHNYFATLVKFVFQVIMGMLFPLKSFDAFSLYFFFLVGRHNSGNFFQESYYLVIAVISSCAMSLSICKQGRF